MATFVLVHGAWHGSWCWKRVRRALQVAGHDVFTPTLTGVGERSHLLSPAVDLETHIMDVVNLIRWEELTDVVLCGHSYGGCVISGAADRISERIRALVYLDAFVLNSGESLLDTLPPEQAAARRALLVESGGYTEHPIPAEFFAVNLADRAWVDAQCTPHPSACFEQKLHIAGGLDTIPSITHVLATGYAQSPFPFSHERAKTRGWKTTTIHCGHDVMLDKPAEVAELLLKI